MPTSTFSRLLAGASCLFIAGGNPVFSEVSEPAAKKPPAVEIIKEAEAMQKKGLLKKALNKKLNEIK